MTGKNILILGLGKTGWSCVCHYHRLGNQVSVMDSRDKPPCLQSLKRDFPNVPVITGGFDVDCALQADQIILSPGIAYHQPVVRQALKAGIKVIGDIEVFAQAANAPVAAVTGTNGKSTVTRMLTLMIAAAGRKSYEGGNFGTPALDLLTQPKPDAYVLELSSFQLQSTYTLKPKVACIVNISPDHLDWHLDFDEYLQSKLKIYNQCDVAVINADDQRIQNNIPNAARVLKFSASQKADFHIDKSDGQSCLMFRDKIILPVDELRIVGRFNWENALAASAMAVAMDIPLPTIAQTLREFSGLEHRCQWVTEHNGVNWYNDSKGTNVGATVAAIESFTNENSKVLLIAGGLAKGAEFSALTAALAGGLGRAAILYGADAKILQQALKDVVPVICVKDLNQAVMQANQSAQQGDVVLFSPACASFDMFSNYRQRGDCFVDSVKKVLHGS